MERMDTSQQSTPTKPMNPPTTHLFAGMILPAALLLNQCAAIRIASGDDKPHIFLSPDKSHSIEYTLRPVIKDFNESSQTAVLKTKNATCWTYGCVARGFEFSWTPDSSGFLFGITHITREMYLYYVHIEPDGNVYPVSIDLESIRDRIASSLPKVHGSSAPKYRIDFETAKWISSKTCRLQFSQSFLGENADSILELSTKDPFHPKVTIVSTTPR